MRPPPPPSYLSKLAREEGGSWGGGFGCRVCGGEGNWRFGRGGGFPRWGGGGLRATHYHHMHTSRGDVCLGVWGYGGTYVIIASLPGYVLLIWCSKHGRFDETEACTKKIERHWRHAPQPTISQNPAWGGGFGTRPRYLIVCLWRRPLASRHRSF